MSFDPTALHLLRPQWLWALLALPMLAWLWQAHRRRTSVWRTLVDPHLLPHLLDDRSDARRQGGMWLGALGYVLAVLALAGPSWRQVEQPLWQSRTPLVVALDLSSATLAGDLPPSRLAQARAKISYLLRERHGGQIGLVAYAGDAFTVAPLTDDADNVALFLDALAPDVMPVDGQRTDRAITWSTRLLRQAGFREGDILILTDHADAAALAAASTASRAGYRVSVLGLGTVAGAPYRQSDGAIAQARLDVASLRSLADKGGGRYVDVSADDADLHALGVLNPGAAGTAAGGGEKSRAWHDEGYWLLLPLMLLALFAFRRRGVAVLLVLMWMPWQSVHAGNWWQRPDQAAHERMQEGAQAYRKGDFTRAAQLYDDIDSADGHYNRGNAMAKAGQYAQAISAYDQALRLRPRMADAQANKRAVEAAMKRKPPKGNNQSPSKPQPNQGQRGHGNPQPGQGDQQPLQSSPAGQSQADEGRQQRRTPPPADEATKQDGAAKDSKPADPQAQQAADAAQRERMQRALQQAGKQDGKAESTSSQPRRNETAEQRERRLANEAWLRRVPDEPGGLLREKFRIEHERRQRQGGGGE